jgi:hypothetical protein
MWAPSELFSAQPSVISCRAAGIGSQACRYDTLKSLTKLHIVPCSLSSQVGVVTPAPSQTVNRCRLTSSLAFTVPQSQSESQPMPPCPFPTASNLVSNVLHRILMSAHLARSQNMIKFLAPEIPTELNSFRLPSVDVQVMVIHVALLFVRTPNAGLSDMLAWDWASVD